MWKSFYFNFNTHFSFISVLRYIICLYHKQGPTTQPYLCTTSSWPVQGKHPEVAAVHLALPLRNIASGLLAIKTPELRLTTSPSFPLFFALFHYPFSYSAAQDNISHSYSRIYSTITRSPTRFKNLHPGHLPLTPNKEISWPKSRC
jgi:hypothetical protein